MQIQFGSNGELIQFISFLSIGLTGGVTVSSFLELFETSPRNQP